MYPLLVDTPVPGLRYRYRGRGFRSVFSRVTVTVVLRAVRPACELLH
ncbi:hypothetical protein NXW10_16965 [Bacteroides fragilis]|nr:hypothetical protein NXW10_16965 [Bacteroides fragilis]